MTVTWTLAVTCRSQTKDSTCQLLENNRTTTFLQKIMRCHCTKFPKTEYFHFRVNPCASLPVVERRKRTSWGSRNCAKFWWVDSRLQVRTLFTSLCKKTWKQRRRPWVSKNNDFLCCVCPNFPYNSLFHVACMFSIILFCVFRRNGNFIVFSKQAQTRGASAVASR